jgi:hypothetical protein
MRTVILGLVAVALLALGAEPAQPQAWVNQRVNPWTGNVHTRAVKRNPWTGTVGVRNTVYNPWTGGVRTNTVAHNPWVGGVQRGGVAVNPWTGRVGGFHTYRRW